MGSFSQPARASGNAAPAKILSAAFSVEQTRRRARVPACIQRAALRETAPAATA